MTTPKKRFHDGREPELPTFIRYPERPLRSVPASTPSTRSAENLSRVLDSGEPPLRYMIVGDRRWMTGRRAALAALAIALYVVGVLHGVTIGRRAVVAESAIRAELAR